MTRFFYTDLLAAAWMAKHFGMRFDQGLFGLVGKVTCDDGRLSWEPGIGSAGRRLYVHPDSLHLLEPQVGDLAFVDNQHGSEYWDEVRAIVLAGDENYPHVGDDRPIMRMDCGQFDYFDRLRRIIQRNGLAFHWPEQEAA